MGLVHGGLHRPSEAACLRRTAGDELRFAAFRCVLLRLAPSYSTSWGPSSAHSLALKLATVTNGFARRYFFFLSHQGSADRCVTLCIAGNRIAASFSLSLTWALPFVWADTSQRRALTHLCEPEMYFPHPLQTNLRFRMRPARPPGSASVETSYRASAIV